MGALFHDLALLEYADGVGVGFAVEARVASSKISTGFGSRGIGFTCEEPTGSRDRLTRVQPSAFRPSCAGVRSRKRVRAAGAPTGAAPRPPLLHSL